MIDENLDFKKKARRQETPSHVSSEMYTRTCTYDMYCSQTISSFLDKIHEIILTDFWDIHICMSIHTYKYLTIPNLINIHDSTCL